MADKYPVSIYGRPNGFIRAEEGATAGATLGVDLRDAEGNLVDPATLDAGAAVTAHEAELDPHPQYATDATTISAGTGLSGGGDLSANRTLSLNLTYADARYPVLTSGKVSQSVLPALAITDTFSVASQAAMLALAAERGDIAIRSDINKTFILGAEPASTLANWKEMLTPTDSVQSVSGRTGVVTLTKADVGLGSVDNTSDAAKPVSTETQTALNAKLGNSPDPGTADPNTLSSGVFVGYLRTDATVNTPLLSWTDILSSMDTSGTWGYQLAHPWFGEDLYIRSRQSGANSAWFKFHHTGNFDPATKLDVGATAANATSFGGTGKAAFIYGTANRGTSISQDMNATDKSGFYESSSGQNGPVATWQWYLQHSHSNGAYGWQLTNTIGSNDFHVRGRDGGTYMPWVKLWSQNNFDPATKANSNAPVFTGSVDLVNGDGSQTHFNHAGSSNNYIRGANLSIDCATVVNAALTATAFRPGNADGAYLDGNGSGIRLWGNLYHQGVPYNLAANGAIWVRIPRTFVGPTVDINQMSDGDIHVEI